MISGTLDGDIRGVELYAAALQRLAQSDVPDPTLPQEIAELLVRIQGIWNSRGALLDTNIEAQCRLFTVIDILESASGGGLNRVQQSVEPSRDSLEGVDDKLIRETFYNTLAGVAATSECVTPESARTKETRCILAALTLVEAMEASKQLRGAVALLNGKAVNLSNCPRDGGEGENFLPLVQATLKLKNAINGLSPEQLKQLKKELKSTDAVTELGTVIKQIAETVVARPKFCEMIDEVTAFFLEANGSTIAREIVEQEPSFSSQLGVTTALVRTTFYQTILRQARYLNHNKLVPLQALEDQDPYVFLALPAQTTIEVLVQSRHIKGGFQLDEGKVLTRANIPVDFDGREEIVAFFDALSGLKGGMSKMTPKQTELLRRFCVDNPDIETMTPELKPYLTDDVKELAHTINQIASRISRRGMFHQLVPEVMKEAVRELKSI